MKADGSSRATLLRPRPSNAERPSNPEAAVWVGSSFNLESELTFCMDRDQSVSRDAWASPPSRVSSALEAYAAVGAREDGDSPT